jgi:hypothetical protein
MSEWISVKDRYPSLGSKVLVWFGDEVQPYMDCWTYTGDNGYFRLPRKRCYYAQTHQCVTHWMPLPAPPEEQK